MASPLKHLNFIAECRALNWKLVECPPFLFLIMGWITIVSMVATHLLASRYYDEPQIAAFIVLIVATFFLIIGYTIIRGFNKIAETNRLKSEFVSIVSHQLRSPLSVLQWTLERSLKEAEDGATPALKTMEQAAGTMTQLVNSLLELSRIESGTLTLNKDTISLSEMSTEISDEYRDFAEATNITLSLNTSQNLPRITADKERIRMVMQTLIENAIQYTEKSGNVTITVSENGKYLIWTITDQGMGIPALQQRFIFQKFFRAENARRHVARGTGIGLAVSKIIIEKSGGSIGFISKEGHGSTFCFTLPINSRAHAAPAKTA